MGRIEATNICQRLGVRRVINAMGSVTVLGGATMTSQVQSAMVTDNASFVDMVELSSIMTLSGQFTKVDLRP